MYQSFDPKKKSIYFPVSIDPSELFYGLMFYNIHLRVHISALNCCQGDGRMVLQLYVFGY